MSGKKSKDKGNAYEREVAKFLSETYKESFIRAPHSGAYIGGTNSKRKDTMSQNQISTMKSDIVAPDNWHNVSLECKFYKDFSFDSLFTGNNTQLDGWIKQVEDAADENDMKIIFMKFNRKGQWVCWHTSANFPVENALLYKGWKFCSWNSFWNELSKNQFKYYCINGI